MILKLLTILCLNIIYSQENISNLETSPAAAQEVKINNENPSLPANLPNEEPEIIPDFNFENILKLTQKKMLEYPIDSCIIIEETLRVSNNNLKELYQTTITPSIRFLAYLIKRMLIENYTAQFCNKPLAEYYSKFSALVDSIIIYNQTPLDPNTDKRQSRQKVNSDTITKGFKPFMNGESQDLENGDILISTSNLIGSSYLRTFTSFDSLFTHASIVYISPKDSKTYLISVDLKYGASKTEFYQAIQAKNFVRFIILRSKDKNVANKAAEKAFNLVSNLSLFESMNLFDFKFDLKSNDKFYCTEFIYSIFNQVKPGFFSSELISKINFLPNSLPRHELGVKELNVILPINFLNSKNLRFVSEFSIGALVRGDHKRFNVAKHTIQFPLDRILASQNYLDKFYELIWPFRSFEYLSYIFNYFNFHIPYFQLSKYSSLFVRLKIENTTTFCGETTISLKKSKNQFTENDRNALKAGVFKLDEFKQCFDREIVK